MHYASSKKVKRTSWPMLFLRQFFNFQNVKADSKVGKTYYLAEPTEIYTIPSSFDKSLIWYVKLFAGFCVFPAGFALS